MKRLAITTTTKEKDPVIISNFNYDEEGYNFRVSPYSLVVENMAGETLIRYSIQRAMKVETFTMNKDQIYALEVTMPTTILMIQVKAQDIDKLLDLKNQIETKVDIDSNKSKHDEHILSLLRGE
jgi:hypothetical protein